MNAQNAESVRRILKLKEPVFDEATKRDIVPPIPANVDAIVTYAEKLVPNQTNFRNDLLAALITCAKSKEILAVSPASPAVAGKK